MLINRVWQARVQQPGKRAPGPIGLAIASAKAIGWKPQRETAVWLNKDGACCDMLNVTVGSWHHSIRAAGRSMLCKAVQSKRANLAGIEQGVDAGKTAALLRRNTLSLRRNTLSEKLGPEERPLLRRILADSIWTESLHYRIGRLQSPACPRCGAQAETLEHLWWECPAFEQQRSQFPAAVNARRTSWPACLTNCGICPVNVHAPETTIQKMMVSVLAARHALEQSGAAAARAIGGRRLPRHCSRNALPAVAVGATRVSSATVLPPQMSSATVLSSDMAVSSVLPSARARRGNSGSRARRARGRAAPAAAE